MTPHLKFKTVLSVALLMLLWHFLSHSLSASSMNLMSYKFYDTSIFSQSPWSKIGLAHLMSNRKSLRVKINGGFEIVPSSVRFLILCVRGAAASSGAIN